MGLPRAYDFLLFRLYQLTVGSIARSLSNNDCGGFWSGNRSLPFLRFLRCSVSSVVVSDAVSGGNMQIEAAGPRGALPRLSVRHPSTCKCTWAAATVLCVRHHSSYVGEKRVCCLVCRLYQLRAYDVLLLQVYQLTVSYWNIFSIV